MNVHSLRSLLLAITSSVFLAACGSGIATMNRTVAGIEPEVRQAGLKTAENLGYKATPGPVRASIVVSGLRAGSIEIPEADGYLEKPSGSVLNNTGVVGAFHVDGSRDSSRIEVSFGGTGASDPRGHAGLFLQSVEQELQLESGKRSPATNAVKSVPGYVARSLVTPLWGNAYILGGNPLLTQPLRLASYGVPLLFEGIGAGSLIAGVTADNAKDRRNGIAIGVLYLVTIRGLSMFGIQDVRDYNAIARSPYNLVEIKF